ncbi:beta-lactamase/transpeptidase-like protein [Auricularia subglabra TFB-10046 SS5]|nr:beta-lactamase/transpeptidase-like protein [Auricularia subglabra TFB-10046 SS5]
MPAQQSEAMRTRIRGILNEAVRSGAVVGALFAAVDKDGAIVVNEAAGLRALGRPEPMDDDTYFPLYSMTKIVTSIAVMQLVYRGLITLDDSIDDTLPELRPGALKLLTDAGKLVDIPHAPTLRMLLAHVSGFAYSTGSPKLAAFLDARDGPERPNEFSGEIRPVFGSPLVFGPGTSWAYGTGLDWAGRAVERVTHMSLGAYCQEHIFSPLNITDMAFRIPDAQLPNLVGMHTRLENGTLVPSEFQGSVFRAKYDSGGHGAFGTARSFLLILAALLNGGVAHNTGARILPDAAVREMFGDQGEVVPAWRDGIRAIDIDLTHGSSRKGQGLSFQLNLDDLPTGRRAFSGAWAGAANSYYAVDRASGIAHVFMAQSGPAFDPVVMDVWRAAERALYDSGVRAE